MHSAESHQLRPVFIGGCPRSGTTLLGALLGAHSRCLCVPEMPFKVGLLTRLDWEGGGATVDSIERFLQSRRKFHLWGVSARPNTSRPRLPYKEAVQSFINAYAARARRTDTTVWVDHTPYNVRHGKRLLTAFPEARVIHLVRDGRGVAASILNVDFGPNSMLGAAGLWGEWLGYGLALENLDHERVLRVRYEDLLQHPQAILTDLCRRLGLEAEPQLGLQTRYALPAYTSQNHALVQGPPDSSRADAWRRTLTPRQVEIFENATADLLPLMGYRLEYDGRARRASSLEHLQDATRSTTLGLWNHLRNRIRLRRHKMMRIPTPLL